MGSDRAVLGNAEEQVFATIWRNDAFAEFRAKLLNDEPPDVCRGCSWYRGVF